jgi:hypothetical protein
MTSASTALIDAAEAACAKVTSEADLNEIVEMWRRAAESTGCDTCHEKLSLFLCQLGRDAEAAKLLRARGYRYRLARGVLMYPLDGEGGKGGASPPGEIVCAVDDALPAAMLEWLRGAFSPSSTFWRTIRYSPSISSPSPYLSFVHPLAPAGSMYMDKVIAEVRAALTPFFPALSKAKMAEVWVHNRPHHSGHQMHFDSDDEGRGGIRNPIASCVVYLSDSCGGPTVVTSQRIDARTLAREAWAVFPRLGRITVFDGLYLHGVVPGRGVPRPGAVRITLMIAYWEALEVRDHPAGEWGSAMPSDRWPDEIKHFEPPKDEPGNKRKRRQEPRPAPATHITPVYETLSPMDVLPSSSLPPYNQVFQGF